MLIDNNNNKKATKTMIIIVIIIIIIIIIIFEVDELHRIVHCIKLITDYFIWYVGSQGVLMY